ncbi:5'-nucleotidase SurE [compost metagenome]
MNRMLTGGILAAGLGLALPAQALNILLTNDDGCRAPGIAAVYKALSAAGHNVTLVAPQNDSSGIGAASVVSPGQALAVSKLADHQYCVGAPDGYATPAGKNMAIGTPVDAVNVGLDLLLKDSPPDLVVSGSNFGDNTGPLIQMSGTLNAAYWAMRKGVPAIAISTAIDLQLFARDQKAGYQKTLAALDGSARFAVQVLDQALAAGSKACAGKKDCELNILGLPKGSGLNLNYPVGEVRGVTYAPVGDWSPINFRVEQGEDGTARVNLAAPAKPTEQQRKSDAWLVSNGYAVVSVIDSGNGISAASEQSAQHIVQALKR